MVNQQSVSLPRGAARWVPTHSRLLQISESIYNLSGVRITVKHKARDFELHSPVERFESHLLQVTCEWFARDCLGRRLHVGEGRKDQDENSSWQTLGMRHLLQMVATTRAVRCNSISAGARSGGAQQQCLDPAAFPSRVRWESRSDARAQHGLGAGAVSTNRDGKRLHASRPLSSIQLRDRPYGCGLCLTF